ncbi:MULTISPECIES: DUF6438 domain-containing protein [Candidatus Accumulibacter]|uniref:DUF6438 domain-containing protein n=1 Tax=Candidatus Accumulibacter cognatus TaxID=2954383 RepID=A0A7D5NDZ8_9PROT|nr:MULTISPECIES: DUF6438 domain-containing protein [Candidatus Accumulibacter]MBL8400159.1 hypothetical protein [Accumulibacter sp.]QLH50569.1 MAG: hypothetical protein HWD57_12820 [Candidatus Accumulibacter cognatus]
MNNIRGLFLGGLLMPLLTGGSSGAYAESLSKEIKPGQPIFTLEKRYKRKQTNLYQEYRIEIYRDQTILFHGIWNTRLIGDAQGKISNRQFHQIYAAFRDILFSDLKSHYGSELRDKKIPLETESEYTITLHNEDVQKTVVFSNAVPVGIPPGMRLLIDKFKHMSGARQWACPAVAQAFPPHGEFSDVCDFFE